ncbi:MAG TPA: hypothetical protein VMV29_10005, partial [Ktedonobacterales bacterium]|nr:hypothetical protein [Ktedonobacterales bacterium]
GVASHRVGANNGQREHSGQRETPPPGEVLKLWRGASQVGHRLDRRVAGMVDWWWLLSAGVMHSLARPATPLGSSANNDTTPRWRDEPQGSGWRGVAVSAG